MSTQFHTMIALEDAHKHLWSCKVKSLKITIVTQSYNKKVLNFFSLDFFRNGLNIPENSN
jgi:hypothetical protein